MYQGTTPLIIFTVKEYDLTSASVFVTFKKNNDLMTKTGDDLIVSYDGTQSLVKCSLTQEDTLAMKKGGVRVQIRFIYSNGQAYATDKADVEVEDVLWPVVIQYEGAGG